MRIYNNYPLVARVREVETFRIPALLPFKVSVFATVIFFAIAVEGFAMVSGMWDSLFDWAAKRIEANGGWLTSEELREKLTYLLRDPQYLPIMLFSTGFATLTIFFYCRVIEGRKLGTLGFRKKGCILQYILGLFSGTIMFSLIVLLAWAMGGLSWNGFHGGSVGNILLVLAGFVIQGMSEEVIFRGFVMTGMLRHQNVWWAVGLNAFAFGIIHGPNTGFTAIALLNLTLFGVVASLYVLRTDNLWGACAIHSIWNFLEGNFYGLPVSGIDTGDTVFTMSLRPVNAILNGGDFGIEASLAATIVLSAAIAVLLFVPLPFAVNTLPEAPKEAQA